MEEENFLFTSESVGEGHPDKLCDQVSDAILDAYLEKDPNSKVACETATKTGLVMILGEISSTATVDTQKVVRDTIKKIGYNDSSVGFDYKTCSVQSAIEQQGCEIADSVHTGKKDTEIGAGDQGYATDETEEMMPLTISLAHKLNRKMAECRRDGTLAWIRPDSKTMVTVEYKKQNGACIPKRVHTIVISVQHSEEIGLEDLKKKLREYIIEPVVPEKYLDDKTIYCLQPSGSFIVGGPKSDAGVTGRKIIVDTYGGWGAHGGGAFSGKDASKVDRSGAYAARWIAKSVVAAGLARRVLIQVSYAIAEVQPVSLYVDAYGTGTKSNEELRKIVEKNFDLRPGMIIKELGLNKPIFGETACYGHFGRPQFTWEQPKKLQ